MTHENIDTNADFETFTLIEKLAEQRRQSVSKEGYTLEKPLDIEIIQGKKVAKLLRKEIEREVIKELKVEFKLIKRRFTKPQHTHNLDLLAIEMEKEGLLS